MNTVMFFCRRIFLGMLLIVGLTDSTTYAMKRKGAEALTVTAKKGEFTLDVGGKIVKFYQQKDRYYSETDGDKAKRIGEDDYNLQRAIAGSLEDTKSSDAKAAVTPKKESKKPDKRAKKTKTRSVEFSDQTFTFGDVVYAQDQDDVDTYYKSDRDGELTNAGRTFVKIEEAEFFAAVAQKDLGTGTGGAARGGAAAAAAAVASPAAADEDPNRIHSLISLPAHAGAAASAGSASNSSGRPAAAAASAVAPVDSDLVDEAKLAEVLKLNFDSGIDSDGNMKSNPNFCRNLKSLLALISGKAIPLKYAPSVLGHLKCWYRIISEDYHSSCPDVKACVSEVCSKAQKIISVLELPELEEVLKKDFSSIKTLDQKYEFCSQLLALHEHGKITRERKELVVAFLGDLGRELSRMQYDPRPGAAGRDGFNPHFSRDTYIVGSTPEWQLISCGKKAQIAAYNMNQGLKK